MIEKMIEAAKAGGKKVYEYFGQVLELEQKSTISDFRTKADLESEKAILSVLENFFPSHSIFSEETGVIDKKSEYMFVVDPLDGTNNFSLGIPNFTVSIGLLKSDRCIAGVIYAPFLDRVYSAEEGKGAYSDGKRLVVSKEKDIKKASVSYTQGYGSTRETELETLKKLGDIDIKRSLTNWSPAYDFCLLASGKIEAIINNQNGLYDFAAGKVIAREAGAIITDFNNDSQNDRETFQFLASANMEIHNRLLPVLPK